MSLISIDKVNDEIRNTLTIMDQVIDALSKSKMDYNKFINMVKSKAYKMTIEDAKEIEDLIAFDNDTLLFYNKSTIDTDASRDVINMLNFKYYSRINTGLKDILEA